MWFMSKLMVSRYWCHRSLTVGDDDVDLLLLLLYMYIIVSIFEVIGYWNFVSLRMARQIINIVTGMEVEELNHFSAFVRQWLPS